MRGLGRKAWRDLRQRPLRTLLTICGIAIGVAGLVAITSTARNLERAQRELVLSTSQADLTYWVWDAPAGLVPLVEADPRVAAAELRLTYTARWRVGGAWQDIEFVGLDDFRVRVNQFTLVAGDWPGLGQVVLDISTGALAPIAPGMEIAYRAPDGRERYLQVSGLSRSPSYLSSAITKVAVGYVPATFLRQVMGIPGHNQLLVQLRDPRDAPRVMERIERLLRRQQIQHAPGQVRPRDQFPGKRELDALVMVLFLFSALGLAVSGLLVVNTLSAVIAEQVQEIGILKSLGATRRQVAGLYLFEALLYGLAGTGLGIVLGAWGGWRLLAWIATLGNAEVTFRLAPEGLILGGVVGLGVTAGSALWPTWRGAKITVKEALETYGIQADFGTSWPARLLRRLPLPPLAAMAVRNLGRRPGRSGLTLAVIALATAAFLSATTTRASVVTAINAIYRTYGADAWVSLGRAVEPEFERLARTVEGVMAAEGWVLADGTVGLAEARLWGLPAESTLYRHVLRQGRWFRADEPDAVVLSAELADGRKLAVGDRVEVQTNGHSRTMTVVGIAVDNTIFLGGSLAGKAFLPRKTLSRLLGSEERWNLFALGLTTREPPAADAILAEVERKFAALRPLVQPIYVEIAAAREASRLLTLALVSMVVLVAALGALGVLNTLTLNVLERRREIAVLRAVGARDAAVLLIFLTEGLVLGAAGWVLGLAAGYPAGLLFTAQMSRVLFSLKPIWAPLNVLGSALFALLLAILASIGPALAAARTPVSAGLRYE